MAVHSVALSLDLSWYRFSYYQRQVCDLDEHWKNGNKHIYFKGLL